MSISEGAKEERTRMSTTVRKEARIQVSENKSTPKPDQR